MGAESDNSLMKWVSLILLTLQNSALVLCIRYSVISQKDSPYLASTAVAMSESMKVVVSTLMVIYTVGYSPGGFIRDVSQHLTSFDMVKISVPSFLYVVQNNLLIAALNYLDAATYQISYQLKIFTTAIFSVVMLGRKLSYLKWFALTILFVGVSLVQLPQDGSAAGEAKQASEAEQVALEGKLVGGVILLCACFTSGFCGVYMEKIIKGHKVSLWIRNLQIALISVVFSFFGAYQKDGDKIAANGFFQGYSQIVWVVITLTALGGFIISTVMKYADNITKGFACAVSIIISTVLSYFIMDDFVLTPTFMAGAPLVISAVFLYGYEPKKPKEKSS